MTEPAFKVMILLSRREDLTHDEFISWWFDHHRPMAVGLPGLRRLVFNDCRDSTEIDGVSELWFDSEQAYLDAYGSDHGQRVAADSLAHVRSRVRLVVGEHRVAG